nr:helix-turn-helix transcriptional regulator [Pedobacter sp. SYSU D00823]
MVDNELEKFRENLGKRIGQLREQKNIPQSSLAAILGGKDKQAINRYERQGANPTAYNLWLIAKALDVTLNDLVDFSKLK